MGTNNFPRLQSKYSETLLATSTEMSTWFPVSRTAIAADMSYESKKAMLEMSFSTITDKMALTNPQHIHSFSITENMSE